MRGGRLPAQSNLVCRRTLQHRVAARVHGLRALNQLNDEEWQLLKKHYLKIENDLKVVGEFVSWENINMLMEMKSQLAKRANMNTETIEKALTNS